MLFKNVLRTLKARWLQLILLGIMILLSSFIYATMDYAISGTLEPTEAYFDEYNQEDFAIGLMDLLLEDDITYIAGNCPVFLTINQADWPYALSGVKDIDQDCYEGVLDRRLSLLESKYNNINLEIRESKDVYFKDGDTSYRFRMVMDMDTINQTYIVEGTKPTTNTEIATSEVFAKKNDLSIGDTIDINGTVYTLTGYALFPDYSLTVFDNSIIIDNETQSVALVTDDAFYQMDERIKAEIAGTFDSLYTDDDFETDVIYTYRDDADLSFITHVTLTINNMRSGAIYSELSGAKGMSIGLSLLIASIALMIVAIMVSRVLHAQRGPIGILKSMGYTNGQIARPYLFFITIMSLPMILIGYFIGLQMAHPFMLIYLDYYVIPYQEIVQKFSVVMIAIIVPFTFIVGLSYIIILRLLRQKPVDLLNPEATSSTNKITVWVAQFFKKLKITTKLQQLLLYRNIIKFTVFLIGMFFAAFLVLFTFSMNGIFDRMIYDYYETTDHNYIGYCDYVGDCDLPDGAEGVIELPSVVVNDEAASILAIDSSSVLHPIYDKRGREITSDLDDGIIITQSNALTRGYKVGDDLTILIGEEEVTYPVVSISEEYTGNKLYMSRSELGTKLDGNEDYYNAVFSESELTRENYLLVVDIDTIIEQADAMSGFMTAFVGIMVFVSISIGAMIIYILTVMTIEDNFYNISLFKVIGYNTKEVNRIILGGYLLYGIGIFILSVPIAMLSFYIMQVYFAQFYDLLFPVEFAWWHGIVAVAIYIVLFYIGAFSAKKKLEHVSLQEAMKMYQI